MTREKTKIVLDADVVIHFMKGDCFSLLLDIFPEYQYLILDVVYEELSKKPETGIFIDNYIRFKASRIQKVKFNPIAYVRKKMTKEDCDSFIQQVIAKGSKLPVVDISQYCCSVEI